MKKSIERRLFSMRSLALAVISLACVVPRLAAQSFEDKQATFFMGRVKYSSNDGQKLTLNIAVYALTH